ncbi:hypothetical protein [Streptomyces fulvoviolaceus]|uniref:hypothetical protein n=1 Tax=Streptomyces fulvoviolaceus TaxID=285535 RepID=UPI0021C00F7B|nr:hypothetical protein [Streptomyces fulvoviolaceus]MCT9078798.1 hypothetical protein [Streptomyces fulvoviolaceus]
MAHDPDVGLQVFFNVKQATVKLGLSADDPKDLAGQRWLRDGANHKGFPHHRMSGRLVFSAADLAEIAGMHRNAPTRRGRPRRTRPRGGE